MSPNRYSVYNIQHVQFIGMSCDMPKQYNCLVQLNSNNPLNTRLGLRKNSCTAKPAEKWIMLAGKYLARYYFVLFMSSDWLLTKNSGASYCSPNKLMHNLNVVWVVEKSKALYSLPSIYLGVHNWNEMFIDYAHVKEWRLKSYYNRQTMLLA